MLVLDIIVLVLIALGAFSGHKKGLVGIIVGFASLILSIVLAFALQSAVANALYDSGIGKSLNTSIGNSIQDKIDDGEKIEDTAYGKIVAAITTEEDVNNAAQIVTKFILKGISFIIILFIVHLICYILQMVLNVVFNLPILSSINGIGGTVLGALSILLKIWIALAILSFLAPIPMFESIKGYVDQTMLIKFLYNHNFLVALLKIGLKI